MRRVKTAAGLLAAAASMVVGSMVLTPGAHAATPTPIPAATSTAVTPVPAVSPAIIPGAKGVTPDSAGFGSQWDNEYWGTYLNAWGGGPHVDGNYSPALNNDFGYYALNGGDTGLEFGGTGVYAGYCIGDLNNSSSDARAGLAGYCDNGDVPWGGNIQERSWSGCQSGAYLLWDYHWAGYVGGGSGGNGSPIYLNIASPSSATCYIKSAAY